MRTKKTVHTKIQGTEEDASLYLVSNTIVFEHYGKPFTSGRELWDFLTENYDFVAKK